jgi:hypothetical protein
MNKKGIIGLVIGGAIAVASAIGLYKGYKAKQEAEAEGGYVELDSADDDVDAVEESAE